MAQALVPADSAVVLDTLRLGWEMSELRGRYVRWMQPLPASPTISLDARPIALPLSEERTPKEQLVQVERVVKALAQKLGLDFCCTIDFSYSGKCLDDVASAELTTLGKIVVAGTDPIGRDEAWCALTCLLYAWDAKIQDVLAAGTVSQAAAYQLGRALSDVWWARDEANDATGDACNWGVLLGEERREAMCHRLNRLDNYFAPAVAPAVKSSIACWGNIAADTAWRRQPDAVPALFRQMRLWRDLLLGETNPETLISTSTVLDHLGSVGPILRAFRSELILSVTSLLVLGIAIILLANGAKYVPLIGHNYALGAVAALFGSLGITTAGLLARVKSTATDMVEQLRTALFAELLALEITLCPARASVKKRLF